jgi:hypothetical protein
MMETAFFRDNPRIQGVLLAFQGGMEGACAEAELLMGLASPSGKLTLVSDKVAEPVKVRYLFNSPWYGALRNRSGIPSGPFILKVQAP